MACKYSNDLDIIKYLVEELKFDINHYNMSIRNGFILACKGSDNLDIIKYLAKKLKLDVNHGINDYYSIGLAYACKNKKNNLDIIKYLVENLKLKLDNNCVYGKENGFVLACKNKNDLSIIKYLAEKLNIKRINDDYIVKLACKNKNNLEVIKYLIEELGNYNLYSNDDGALTEARKLKDNLDIIMYFVKLKEAKLMEMCNSFEIRRYCEFLLKYDLYDKQGLLYFNELVTYEYYKATKSNSFYISNPYKYKFKKYKFLVDKLRMNHKIWNNELWNKMRNNELLFSNEIKKNDYLSMMHSKDSEIIFENNGHIFYGHKEIIFNEILILNELEIDGSTINLNIDASDRIIYLYLDFIYHEKYDIYKINKNEFISFIKLIEKYPTKKMSLDKMENIIIEYIYNNDVTMNDELMKIIERNELKYLYINFSKY